MPEIAGLAVHENLTRVITGCRELAERCITVLVDRPLQVGREIIAAVEHLPHQRLEARICDGRERNHGRIDVTTEQLGRIAEDQVVVGVAINVVSTAWAVQRVCAANQQVVASLTFEDVIAAEVEVA